MIFVVLGIIILVISFVAALISLIREQKQARLAEGNRLDLPEEAEPAIKAQVSKSASELQNPTVGEEIESGRDRFPWEEESPKVEEQPTGEASGEEAKLGGGFSVAELAGKKKENL